MAQHRSRLLPDAGIELEPAEATTGGGSRRVLLVTNPDNSVYTLTLQWPAQRPNGQPDQPATATVIFADPLLQPLDDHGGPTPTMPLSAGSPALDAGVASGAPSMDQRGVQRPSPDAGAVEGSAASHLKFFSLLRFQPNNRSTRLRP